MVYKNGLRTEECDKCENNSDCKVAHDGRQKRKRRRKERGYNSTTVSTDVQKELRKLGERKPALAVLEGVLTIFSVPMLALACAVSISHMTPLGFWDVIAATGLYIVAATFIARQQRGLELMVHDASHLGWHTKQAINDPLANWIVAVPVLSWVNAYRISHRVHHAFWGGHDDPCRKRFMDMGLGDIDLSTRWKITKAVIKWIAPYNKAYYAEIGSQSMAAWGRFAAWHLGVFILPITAILVWGVKLPAIEAIPYAFLFWLAFWLLPMIVVLPVLRSIAESEEHDYGQDNEFDGTFTNIGFWHKVLIHPKNDGYHHVHHMYPTIPERNHAKVHRLLMEEDPRYAQAAVRKNILEEIDVDAIDATSEIVPAAAE